MAPSGQWLFGTDHAPFDGFRARCPEPSRASGGMSRVLI
jgi:hypothetical protein